MGKITAPVPVPSASLQSFLPLVAMILVSGVARFLQVEEREKSAFGESLRFHELSSSIKHCYRPHDCAAISKVWLEIRVAHQELRLGIQKGQIDLRLSPGAAAFERDLAETR